MLTDLVYLPVLTIAMLCKLFVKFSIRMYTARSRSSRLLPTPNSTTHIMATPLLVTWISFKVLYLSARCFRRKPQNTPTYYVGTSCFFRHIQKPITYYIDISLRVWNTLKVCMLYNTKQMYV